MGIDFTAVLDHRLGGLELDALPETLNSTWLLPVPLRAWVGKYVRSGTPMWKWALSDGNSSASEELFNAGYVTLDGPDGFGCHVHRHAVELWHLARWWSFVHEPEVARGLRESAALVARALGSEKIVYLPDSGLASAEASDLLFDDGSVDQIQRWLAEHVGPPAASDAELRGDEPESLNERAYLVEIVALAG